jgi:periplasmic divalent cation tolerance protein
MDDARRIAGRLIELHLAACVNILPGATSVYRWKGAVETASEFVLVIKSRRDLLTQIEREFATLHPYEVPELIALPIGDGGAAYLEWFGLQLPPEM